MDNQTARRNQHGAPRVACPVLVVLVPQPAEPRPLLPRYFSRLFFIQTASCSSQVRHSSAQLGEIGRTAKQYQLKLAMWVCVRSSSVTCLCSAVTGPPPTIPPPFQHGHLHSSLPLLPTPSHHPHHLPTWAPAHLTSPPPCPPAARGRGAGRRGCCMALTVSPRAIPEK